MKTFILSTLKCFAILMIPLNIWYLKWYPYTYFELSCDHLCVVPADLIIGVLAYKYTGLLKKWFSVRPDNVGDRQPSQKSYRA